MNRIIKKIKRFLGYKGTKRFPYIFSNATYNVKFEINNTVEEYRLRDWGGEEDYVIQFIDSLQESDVFFDVGSSVGLYSILSAKVLTAGRVVSFEPDPENVRRLKRNFEINGLRNHQIVEVAVGCEDTTMKLFTKGSKGFSPSLQPVNKIDDFIEVGVVRIDRLLLEKMVPTPTIMKIDIEGAEFMALKGMKQLLLSTDKPRLIFVEVHPKFLGAFGTSVSEIESFVKEVGYSVMHRIERDEQLLYKLIAN